MRIFFNVIGTLLFLGAIYFGYLAVKFAGVARDTIGQPNSDLAFAWSTSMSDAYGGAAIFLLIGSGVFLGVAEIVAAIERTAQRRDISPDETGDLPQGGAF